MEDGVWVVHQVGWGVELNHLPLVQHQDPETSKRSWSVLRPCHLSKCSIGLMYAVIIPFLSSLASCGTYAMQWLQGKLVCSPLTAVSATASHTIAGETNGMRCNHVQ